MKYAVVIIDGAADRPLPDHNGLTPLQIAHTPNLDRMAAEGQLGLTHTIPDGMEPGSAIGCMSVLGYDPRVYYSGRSTIEACSLDVPMGPDDVVFRCNLVAIRHEKLWSYSAGHISTEEADKIIQTLNEKLGNEKIRFFTGLNFRHILRITGAPQTLKARCTPAHDITDKPIKGYLPSGEGSRLLNRLMKESREILRKHPVNLRRIVTGGIPAHQIWLFWGSGRVPQMPSFKQAYGLEGAMTSGVDLLRGLARMMGMQVLKIPGVTDNIDNDFAAQAEGALKSLQKQYLAVIHVEAPDDAAHDGSLEKKVEALEKIDREIIGRLMQWNPDGLCIMVLPDHATPLELKTHSTEAVPFALWGSSFKPNGASGYSEKDAAARGLVVDPGYTLMHRFLHP